MILDFFCISYVSYLIAFDDFPVLCWTGVVSMHFHVLFLIWGKLSSFPLFKRILAIGVHGDIYQLEMRPSVSIFCSVSVKACWILSKAFSASPETAGSLLSLLTSGCWPIPASSDEAHLVHRCGLSDLLYLVCQELCLHSLKIGLSFSVSVSSLAGCGSR